MVRAGVLPGTQIRGNSELGYESAMSLALHFARRLKEIEKRKKSHERA